MNTAEVITRKIETDQTAIMTELNRLLRNPRFSGSPQMSAFLKYVVTQTLQGNGGRIKAYTIGVEALGKPGSFDAQDDPSVRVLALRLRKALRFIYESEQPSNVIIEIKLGSYVPEFYQTKPQPIEGVQFCEDRSSRVAVEQFSDEGMAVKSQCLAADQSADQMLASRPDETSAVAKWKRSGSLKPAHMMTLFLVVVFFMGVKLTADHRGVGQIQHADGKQSELPVQLLSMAKPVSGQTAAQQAMPTVYLAESDSHSEQLKEISVIISSSLVDTGALNVVRGRGSLPSPNLVGIDYLMLLNEASVESRHHVDAQIFRVDNGAVIMRETLVLDKIVAAFSSVEMSLIERLANAISDSTGPLSQDFCSEQQEAGRSVICT